jgi:hypothetical protein
MTKPKRPKSETRYQRILRLIEDGECGLLPLNYTCPCPRRNGPEHPHPSHPVGLLIGLPVWQGYVSNSSLEDPIPGTDPSAG